MDPTRAVKLIPAIIKKDKTSGELKACLYTGTTYPKANGPKKPTNNQKISADNAKKCAMYAAMLTCYKNKKDKTVLNGKYKKPKTGDKVYAEVILCEKPRYLYWKASKIWLKSDCTEIPKPAGCVPTTWNKNLPFKDPNSNPIIKVVEGTVLITNENIDKKHDERIFFFDNPNLSQIEKVIDDEKIKDWEKLIKNYRDAHSDDDIFNREHNNNPKKPWEAFIKGRDSRNRNIYDYAWSPHLYHRVNKKDRWGRNIHDAVDLQDGDMVYARCEFTGNRISGIKDLFPVTISPRIVCQQSRWPSG